MSNKRHTPDNKSLALRADGIEQMWLYSVEQTNRHDTINSFFFLFDFGQSEISVLFRFHSKKNNTQNQHKQSRKMYINII